MTVCRSVPGCAKYLKHNGLMACLFHNTGYLGHDFGYFGGPGMRPWMTFGMGLVV